MIIYRLARSHNLILTTNHPLINKNVNILWNKSSLAPTKIFQLCFLKTHVFITIFDVLCICIMLYFTVHLELFCFTKHPFFFFSNVYLFYVSMYLSMMKWRGSQNLAIRLILKLYPIEIYNIFIYTQHGHLFAQTIKIENIPYRLLM